MEEMGRRGVGEGERNVVIHVYVLEFKEEAERKRNSDGEAEREIWQDKGLTQYLEENNVLLFEFIIVFDLHGDGLITIHVA